MNRDAPALTLFRYFFTQFFENELTSPQGELRSGIGGILALLAVPGALFSLHQMQNYSSLTAFLRHITNVDRDLATLPDKYILLALAFVIPAFAAILKWDSLYPGPKDHAVLAPLPIRLSFICLAKAGALAAFLLLFAFSVSIGGILFFPAAVLGNTGTFLDLLRFCASHAAAALGAALCGALIVVALQGAIINLGASFGRMAGALQFSLVVYFLAQLTLAPNVASRAVALRDAPISTLLLFPPYWFLCLYEHILARGSHPTYAVLAHWAILALAVSSGIVLVTFVLNYARFFRRIGEVRRSSSIRAPSTGRISAFLTCRVPARHAVFLFITQTLARSRTHRLLFGALAGIGFALVLDGLAVYFVFSDRNIGVRANREAALFFLSAPMVVNFFLLTCFRFLYEIPFEQSANWIFRVLETDDTTDWLKAARDVLLYLAILPLNIALIPVNLLLWGVNFGLAHSAFCLLCSLLLADFLLRNFHKVPFTCPFGTGRWNVTFSLALFYLCFAGYSTLTIWVETLLWSTHFGLWLFLAAGYALFFGYRRLHKAKPEDLPLTPTRLQFHDPGNPAVTTLDLML